MNAKLKKEIKALLNKKLPHTGKSLVYHIVDEIIIGGTIDEIAEQTGDLMGKLTRLDVNPAPARTQDKIDHEISEAHKMIFNALADEVIRQLTEHKTI